MPDVAFCREIHPGMRGDDVIAHKRALSRWNPHVYPWPKDGAFTDFAGTYFFTGLHEYKHEHNLGGKKVLGKITHDAMEKSVCHYAHHGEPAFDDHAVQLAHDFCDGYGKTPEEKIREAIVAEAFWLYAHRMHIGYSQRRPIQMVKPPGIPWSLDCSGYVTLDTWVGGGVDPNGLHFNGEGYTGTEIAHGTRVSTINQLKPADLIFYGYSRGMPGFRSGDPTHVAIYVGLIKGVPSVLSMGHFPMGLYPHNYRTINQMRTYDLLALSA